MLITLSLVVGQGCTTPPSKQDADRLEAVLLRSSADLERLLQSQFGQLGPTVGPYSAFALQQAISLVRAHMTRYVGESTP